ncbi:MAG: LexA family transcriptional regulator [Pseudomonadota bacterium]
MMSDAMFAMAGSYDIRNLPSSGLLRSSLSTDCGESRTLAAMLTHEQILAELKRQTEARIVTKAAVAKYLGIPAPRVTEITNGSRKIQAGEMPMLAQFLGMENSDAVYTPLGPRLFVKGEVAAGVWKEAYELPETEWKSFTGRADVAAEMDHRFGLLVVGDSMNMIYPPGTIVECVSLFGRVELESGKRVVVIRTNDKEECEATVKEYYEDDEGRPWALPRSHNPAFAPIQLDQEEPGIVETRIAAIVVASIRPE